MLPTFASNESVVTTAIIVSAATFGSNDAKTSGRIKDLLPLIVGVVLGGIVAAVVIVIAVLQCRKSSRSSSASSNYDTSIDTASKIDMVPQQQQQPRSETFSNQQDTLDLKPISAARELLLMFVFFF